MEAVRVELFGRDAKALKILGFVRNAAVTKSTILIMGEEGTGKRSLARYAHSLSGRSGEKILFVDCSRDPQTVEDEILGHRNSETGRFTKGVLEMGNGGTIILANVEGLADSFQKRLLKIFNELTDYDIDVRIIATTTKNLSKMVASGKFYRALYTYISGTQITMVSLRERVEDIYFLSQEILKIACAERGCPVPVIEENASKKLLAHYWTHNLGELISVMGATLENSDKKVVTANDLALGDRNILHTLGKDGDGLKLMSLKEAEKLLIKKALLHTSENRTQAAKILGVSIRTLRNKINEYRVEGAQFFVNLR